MIWLQNLLKDIYDKIVQLFIDIFDQLFEIIKWFIDVLLFIINSIIYYVTYFVSEANKFLNALENIGNPVYSPLPPKVCDALNLLNYFLPVQELYTLVVQAIIWWSVVIGLCWWIRKLFGARA